MSASEPIFYLCQTVKAASRFTSLRSSAHEESITLHFYVKAEDETYAGGAAGAFNLEHGLECVEYICLPQLMSKAQIGAHESEHVEAYELALSKGMAVVATTVLTWSSE